MMETILKLFKVPRGDYAYKNKNSQIYSKDNSPPKDVQIECGAFHNPTNDFI